MTLEAMAAKVVVARKAQKVDTREAAINHTGSKRVNDNPKIPWKFEDEVLKNEEGWTMQRDSSSTKRRYFAPDGTRCPSLPKVKQYLDDQKNGTAGNKKQRKKPRTARILGSSSSGGACLHCGATEDEFRNLHQFSMHKNGCMTKSEWAVEFAGLQSLGPAKSNGKFPPGAWKTLGRSSRILTTIRRGRIHGERKAQVAELGYNEANGFSFA